MGRKFNLGHHTKKSGHSKVYLAVVSHSNLSKTTKFSDFLAIFWVQAGKSWKNRASLAHRRHNVKSD